MKKTIGPVKQLTVVVMAAWLLGNPDCCRVAEAKVKKPQVNMGIVNPYEDKHKF